MTRWLRITLSHLRFVALSYRRNPSAAFFTMLFPLMFLVINALLLGKNQVPLGGRMVSLSAFYVAGMAAFAVIMTCFTNLATSILFDRDQSRLKRLRGTPTPVSAYIAARIVFTVFIALLTSGLCVLVGRVFFDVHPQLSALPLFFLVIALGGTTFAALSLTAVAAIPNAQAGPAILNALSFPILFISSIFYPMQGAPKWLETVAGILPVRPFAHAVTGAFFGLGVSLNDVLIVLAWGVGGALLAARFFKWQPTR